MKALKMVVIGGLVFLGGRYLFTLSRAGQKAAVDASARVKGVTLEGIGLELRFNIKNPTSSRLEMAAPLIKVLYQGSILASSSLSLVEIPSHVKSPEGRIMIEPYSETGWITTPIKLPFLTLVTAGAGLVTRLKNKLDPNEDQQTIVFELETNSTIYTKVGSYPYDEKISVTV